MVNHLIDSSVPFFSVSWRKDGSDYSSVFCAEEYLLLKAEKYVIFIRLSMKVY